MPSKTLTPENHFPVRKEGRMLSTHNGVIIGCPLNKHLRTSLAVPMTLSNKKPPSCVLGICWLLECFLSFYLYDHSGVDPPPPNEHQQRLFVPLVVVPCNHRLPSRGLVQQQWKRWSSLNQVLLSNKASTKRNGLVVVKYLFISTSPHLRCKKMTSSRLCASDSVLSLASPRTTSSRPTQPFGPAPTREVCQTFNGGSSI
jgi:hypothetical protein